MPEPAVDDEVGKLARTLEQMLRALDAARAERERAMQKQREFVADASHELRTPLTSVLANLELLQASLGGADQAEDREVVDSALRSSKRMGRLVADLLLLARADAGRLDAHAARPGRIAGDAAAEAAPLMDDRRLVVENGRPLRVEGSRDELHRMVLNLLDNAIRHTPAGSRVELTLREDGDEAVVEVADDGPGIPAGVRDHIFDRFVRGDGPGRHRPRHRNRPRPGDRPRRRRVPRRQRRGGRIEARRRPLRRPHSPRRENFGDCYQTFKGPLGPRPRFCRGRDTLPAGASPQILLRRAFSLDIGRGRWFEGCRWGCPRSTSAGRSV